MNDEVVNCDWDESGNVPFNSSLYSVYESAKNDEVHSNSEDNVNYRATLIKKFTTGQTTCLAFMLKPYFPNYSTYAKLKADSLGNFAPQKTYYEWPFSSAMGLNQIKNNKVTSLSSTDSNGQVKVDISHTLGGLIQGLSIRQKNSTQWTQIVKNLDPADSAFQWSMRLIDPVYIDGPKIGIVDHKEVTFNQAVGANPYWMWGMEMPLVLKPGVSSTLLHSKDNLWVPFYSDIYGAQKVNNQWNKTQFSPRSPLFLPQAVHLFDGRIEEISLTPIAAGSNTVSRLTHSLKVRTHVNGKFSAKAILFEWLALKRSALLPFILKFILAFGRLQVQKALLF
jgi:hypothetical protein